MLSIRSDFCSGTQKIAAPSIGINLLASIRSDWWVRCFWRRPLQTLQRSPAAEQHNKQQELSLRLQNVKKEGERYFEFIQLIVYETLLFKVICDQNHSSQSMLHKLQTASPAVLSVNESKKTTEVSFSSSAGSRYGWPGDAIAVRHHPVPWRGRGEAEGASDPPSDPGQWSASTSPSISVLQPRWASIGRQCLLDLIVFINYQRSL